MYKYTTVMWNNVFIGSENIPFHFILDFDGTHDDSYTKDSYTKDSVFRKKLAKI